jgi:RimJ/RimL family protein N-acetyltransferase
VAYHRGALAGVVLAYRTEGTGVLQYFGLVPEAHGLGLGRAMHVDALRLLRSAGATRYHDSTRVDNTPMRRVFASSGCEVSGYTRLYARGERPEWRPPGRLPVVPRGAHVSLLRKA